MISDELLISVIEVCEQSENEWRSKKYTLGNKVERGKWLRII